MRKGWVFIIILLELGGCVRAWPPQSHHIHLQNNVHPGHGFHSDHPRSGWFFRNYDKTIKTRTAVYNGQNHTAPHLHPPQYGQLPQHGPVHEPSRYDSHSHDESPRDEYNAHHGHHGQNKQVESVQCLTPNC